MERLEALLPLPFANGLLVDLLEVLWSNLEEPFRLDGENFSHVFLGRHHKLVVDDPLWILVEQR